MSNVTIKGGSLIDQVKQLTDACEIEIMTATKDAGKKVAEDTVKTLKMTSPSSKGHGKYKKGWSVKADGSTYTVYNKTHPGLTHLLEKGHDVISHGKKVGRAKAQPHIKPAEEEAVNRYVEEVTKEINRRLSR